MDLRSIGWNKHFRDKFKKYRSEPLLPARVVSEQKKSYILLSSKGELNASARGILWQGDHVPVVGDWVVIKLLIEKNMANIIHILPRKSSFSRKASGGRKRLSGGKAVEQIIVANIDVGIITIALDRDYSLRRIERYLALVQGSGAKPLIVLNKTDLCKEYKTKFKEVAQIAGTTPIIAMSALKKKQVKVLYDYIKNGKTAALLGSSGVGKSTIINQMLGYERQKVKELSMSAGKGQHTTSKRELIMLPNGGLIIDNPGMREVQLWAEKEDLSSIFSDIDLISSKCRFRNCLHDTEPGCAVKESIKKGKIDTNRLKSYIKMKSEISRLNESQRKRK